MSGDTTGWIFDDDEDSRMTPEEYARAAITAELLRQVATPEEQDAANEAYHALMGEILREEPLAILHITNYAATALATATGGFDSALKMWQHTTPALALTKCPHGYDFADCDECSEGFA